MNPLVSIIIPTYNRAHLICETLDSILALTFTNWECIIVDDGSIDETEQVIVNYLKKDNRFQYHHRPVDRQKGANTCRNFGYDLSKGEYIKWFDSDDLMFPDILQTQLNSFTDITDVSVCKLQLYDLDNDTFIKENNIFSDNLIESYFIGNVAFYISGPLWKKSFLMNQNVLFDETISNLDDWDFNLLMLYQAPRIAYIDEVLIKYRVHEASLSNEIDRLNLEEIQSEFRAREKHLKLIKKNRLLHPRVLQNYIKERYKFILREALIQNNYDKSYFLRMLLITQLKTLDFTGLTKTIFGFISYSLFNKGYKLLK